MKNKVLVAAGAAAFALTLSASASYAGYMLPGETMGVSLVSPLPEGVFFADLESYGRSDKSLVPDANVGVNIPVILWSTPWTFYNTRLEFLAAFPFAHVDASGYNNNPVLGPLLNQTGAITWAFGPMFAHDFGNGLTGGLAFLARTPTPSEGLRNADGRSATELDIRQSAQYTFQGFLGGITVIENASYTTGFGAQGAFPAVTGLPNDMFAGDFAIEKTFGKVTVGFTGFGNIDTNSIRGQYRQASVELGGLIGYDFGKFSLTGIVTRSVLVSGVGSGIAGSGRSDTVAGLISQNGYETRGWVRLVVPLYVAPTAPVVSARY